MNKEISYFLGGNTDTTPQSDTITIKEMIESMTDKTSEYKKIFEELRNSNPTPYKNIKNKLPYFTITGQFSYRRNDDLIDNTYTWLCPVDIDYKENLEVNMNIIQNMLCTEDFVLFCGKSPSGKGLKAILRLKEKSYDIKNHYRIITELIYPKLEKALGCVLDNNQAKLSQPFYFTYDDEAYINYDAIELEINYKLKDKQQNNLVYDENSLKKDYLIDKKCDEILNLTDNKWSIIGNIGYTIGGWFKSGYFTLSEIEIKDKLKKAVDDNSNILNKKQKYDQIELTFKNGFDKPIQIKEEKLVDVSDFINDEFEEIIKEEYIPVEITKTDTKITESIYKKLPKILQDITDDFEDEKKDVILLSSLSCLSYYFSNVKFEYFFNNNQYNNIYIFIIATTSSGKSIMNNSKKLLKYIDNYFKDKFNSEYSLYNTLSKNDKDTTTIPKEIVLICGGDATRQGLFKYLQNNDGKLVLFDTEADSMLNQKGDYDYSTLIRKSLQNESFVKLLASQTALRIDTPKLNICISGTKSQLLNVIGENGGENGSFNRFMFYNWETEPIIESPHKKMKQSNIFDEYGKMLFDFYMEHLYYDGEMNFTFSDEQEKIFDKELISTHSKWLKKEDDSVSGIIKRHFLIAKKLCVTISGLRLFDKYHEIKSNTFFNDDYEEPIIDFLNLTISNEDLQNIINIVKIMINHSMQLFRKFTPTDEVMPELGWKEELMNLLPESFNRNKAISFSKVIGKSDKTIDRWLKKIRQDGDVQYDPESKNYFK